MAYGGCQLATRNELWPFPGADSGSMTLHRATLNRATVNRRQFITRQLTAATIKRATPNRATLHRAYHKHSVQCTLYSVDN